MKILISMFRFFYILFLWVFGLIFWPFAFVLEKLGYKPAKVLKKLLNFDYRLKLKVLLS